VQRSRFLDKVKLDPPCEEEEDLASAVACEKVDSLDLVERHEGEEKYVIDLDDDEHTLVGEVGEKEIDVDITDDEASEEEDKEGECGIKRKRTIRVVIRSRAFL